jgi:hypothetical protein
MHINLSKIVAEKQQMSQSNTYSFKDKTAPEFSNELQSLIESSNNVSDYINDIAGTNLGAPFINYYVTTENMSCDDISSLLENISEDSPIRSKLETAKEYYSSMKWLNIDTKYKFARNRYNSTCLFESSYTTELQMINYNINTSPETITRYAKLIQRIETDPYSSVEQVFPELLKKNTELVLGLRVTLTGRTASLFTDLPMVIAKRIVKEGTKKQAKAFIVMIDKAMSDVTAFVNTGEARQYNMDMAYLDSLEEAKRYIEESPVCESTITEHIADMQPDVFMYERGVVEDPTAELEELMSDIVFSDDEEITEESLIKLTRLMNEFNRKYDVVYEGDNTLQKYGKAVSNMPGFKTYQRSIYKNPMAKLGLKAGQAYQRHKIDADVKTEDVDDDYIVDIDDEILSEGMFDAGFANLRMRIANALEGRFRVTNVNKGMGNKDKFDITSEDSDDDTKTTVESTGSGCNVISRGDGKIKRHFSNIALSAAYSKIIGLFNRPDALLDGAIYDDNTMDVAMEDSAGNKAVRKAAYKASDKSRQLASKVDKTRKDNHRTKEAVKRGVDPFIRSIGKWIDDVQKMDKEERRNRIITNQFKLKLLKAFRKVMGMITGTVVLTVALGTVVGVGIALISLITAVAIDKAIDDKTRRQLINELQTELDVVNEKIEDSRGDENKAKKYELIRIKKKLENDLDRVKYRLKES